MTTEQSLKIQESIKLLESLATDSQSLSQLSNEQRVALLKAAGQLSRPNKDEINRRNKALKRVRSKKLASHDRQARAETGIRKARTAAVFTAPLQISAVEEQKKNLNSPRNCYVCAQEYTELHHFYDAMCPICAKLNHHKRFQTADLSGQVALITGARLKIGYQSALMMLRAGARVIVTTRFPKDAAIRFSKESDFSNWRDRLHVYGLDLRHTPSVEIFARYFLQTYNRLDLLIHNAAQTVRRPCGFYSHLMANENLAFEECTDGVQALLKNHQTMSEQLHGLCAKYNQISLDQESALPVTWHGHGPGVGIRASAQLSQIPYSFDQSLTIEEVFPQGQLDADLQQVDLRQTNSWRLRLGEIPTTEMLEVQLVNIIAPFVLSNLLIPLMKRDMTGKKHIVNVSAMEGKFLRFRKADRHPHTNMAKAALNMLTHTAASDLAKYGIFINAVDTGWVTDEDPMVLAKHKQEVHDFAPPLDIVDGAARVCDPFFDGILTGQHWCGKFLKDYQPIDW